MSLPENFFLLKYPIVMLTFGKQWYNNQSGAYPWLSYILKSFNTGYKCTNFYYNKDASIIYLVEWALLPRSCAILSAFKRGSKVFVRITFILASACIMNDRCEVVTDASEALPAFCQSLEAILRQGLKSKLISVSMT